MKTTEANVTSPKPSRVDVDADGNPIQMGLPGDKPKRSESSATPRVIPIKVLNLRSDRPLQLPGGFPPMYAITSNEQFSVEHHPALGMYRIVFTPRPGAAGTTWERMVPCSWGSYERMPA